MFLAGVRPGGVSGRFLFTILFDNISGLNVFWQVGRLRGGSLPSPQRLSKGELDKRMTSRSSPGWRAAGGIYSRPGAGASAQQFRQQWNAGRCAGIWLRWRAPAY